MFTFARLSRNVTTQSRRNLSSQWTDETMRDQLRFLLRKTSQPVAVVTSFMPSTASDNGHTYHGATLSSFTSIAMEPHPLIAFALRSPSRMATSLNAANLDAPSHMVVNLLEASQAPIAFLFSRPDLHQSPFDVAPYSLTEEGLPVLEGSLGAISCKLVSPGLPLHDLDFWENRTSAAPDAFPSPGARAGASQLFIARVLRVEKIKPSDNSRTPLIYYQQRYTTCQPADTSSVPQPPYEFAASGASEKK